jgi:hypothetical protein
LRDGFEELEAAISVIEHQINVLKTANVTVAVQLLEMTKLELMLHLNDISTAELESFCIQVREAMHQKSLSDDI